MTIQEWLSNLKYDPEGQIICKNDNGFTEVLGIRGWSTLQRFFPSREEAGRFQDSVGQFVLEAINEKLENDKQKKELWDKIQEDLADKDAEFNMLLGEVYWKLINSGKPDSHKFQIDNLDWCKLIRLEDNIIIVENEHGTQFDLWNLNMEELKIALESI